MTLDAAHMGTTEIIEQTYVLMKRTEATALAAAMRGDVDQLLIADEAAFALDALHDLIDPMALPEEVVLTVESAELQLRNLLLTNRSMRPEVAMGIDTALGAVGALRAALPS